MITQKQVTELFEYRDGDLIRKTSPANRVKTGDIAGTLTTNGYIAITISAKIYYAHRLIFLYHHGYLPKEIDHRDENKSNNRIENLRECTRSQNTFNTKLMSTNTSGHKGVGWIKRDKMWEAKIRVNGKIIFLGYFDDKEVAAQVVKIERIKLHKEFANHG